MPLEIAAAGQTAQLYARLREAVLGLAIAPGERLTERGLETTFGASRTPARAALVRLETEGLVQREGRGWRVTPIDLDEIQALSEMRATVESAGVRLAVTRASSADLERLSARLEAARPVDSAGPTDAQDAVVRAGGDFHADLAGLSGNPFMVESVEAALVRLARTRWLEVRTPAARLTAWREHRAVLDAVEAKDAPSAATLVADHIRGTNDRLIAALSAERQRLRGHGLAIVGDAREPAPRIPA